MSTSKGRKNPIADEIQRRDGWRTDTPSPKPQPPPQATSLQLVTRRASEIQVAPVTWMWPGRITMGMIAELIGDPGNGKSTITADLAARVSSGEPFPGADPVRREPADVLYLSAEDSAEVTIVPRLRAAGAALDRVHVLDCVAAESAQGRAEGPLVLPDGLDLVREAIDRHQVRLVILDPLNAFLSGRIDSHTDADVRSALMYPLRKLAGDTGASVLLVRHLNKGSGKAVYRAGGSIAFSGAVRASFAVGPQPADDTMRAMACVKMNVAAEPPAVAYRLDSVEVPGAGSTGVVWWGAELDLDANDLLGATTGAERPGNLDDAVQFLRATLTAGPLPATDCYERAAARGISKRTLDRAKATLQVVNRKAGFSGGWRWSLPAEGCQHARGEPTWQPSGKPRGFPEGCHNPDGPDIDPDERVYGDANEDVP